jgi:hypothetical protein
VGALDTPAAGLGGLVLSPEVRVSVVRGPVPIHAEGVCDCAFRVSAAAAAMSAAGDAVKVVEPIATAGRLLPDN